MIKILFHFHSLLLGWMILLLIIPERIQHLLIVKSRLAEKKKSQEEGKRNIQVANVERPGAVIRAH